MAKTLYAIDQCALYKVGSKARLAKILGTSVASLVALANHPRYREFVLDAETCKFTGKITKARSVQEPVGGLRQLHERIRKLLMRVTPPVYAHAAVKGRSYRSNALHHAESSCVGTFDIRKFYPSTSSSAVYRFFVEQLKCESDIAALLTTLVTFRAETAACACLATGSPLSPVLSIYANKPMFDALDALAKKFDLKFSCYVDDLTFSGEKLPAGLTRMVNLIIKRFDHRMAEDKTRIFQKNQGKHITGVIVKNGVVHVPFARFNKARRIQAAMDLESDSAAKLDLARSLAGLLGEAAFLDARYRAWAQSSYRNLNAVRLANSSNQD